MTNSANGWPVLDKEHTTVIKVGAGVALRVSANPDVALILRAVADFVDVHVEDIDTRHGVKGWDTPDDWGWAVRKIRGAKVAISNHASGTAIDLNALRHPMGAKGTWSKAQVAAVDQFLKGFGGVVRWGEKYRTRTDGMHFEINVTPYARGSLIKAAEYARRYFAVKDTPADMQVTMTRILKRSKLRPIMTGPDVAAVQRALGLTPTGRYDNATAAAVYTWQGKHGLTRDGAWGRLSTGKANAVHLAGHSWKWAGK